MVLGLKPGRVCRCQFYNKTLTIYLVRVFVLKNVLVKRNHAKIFRIVCRNVYKKILNTHLCKDQIKCAKSQLNDSDVRNNWIIFDIENK